MTEENDIGKILQGILGNDSDHPLELYDNKQLDPEGRKALAEKLTLIQTVGKICHICGGIFDAASALKAIVLGPIGADGSMSDAHEKCFQDKLEQNPQLKTFPVKPWGQFSEDEKTTWASAFSSIDPGGLFGKLFKR